MTVTITVDESTIKWLENNLRGGIKKKNRARKAAFLAMLAPVPAKEFRVTRKPTAGKSQSKQKYKKRSKTITTDMMCHKLLKAFKQHPDGLTRAEAAGLSGHNNKNSAMASVSALNRDGLIRIVGLQGGANVYILTTRGDIALKEARMLARENV